MICLRDYQEEAVSAVISSYKNNITRQLVVLPTGTGKTVVFAETARRLGMPTLMLAHTEELLFQASRKFKMLWPEASVGLIKASTSDHEGRDVVVASVQTLARENRLKALPKSRFGFLICDEAHHSTAPSYIKIFDRLGFLDGRRKLLLGVTATPHRGDGTSLGAVYQKVSYQKSIQYMVMKGYLVDIRGLEIKTSHDITEAAACRGDYDEKKLSSVLNTENRNELIAKAYLQNAADRKAIVFAVGVGHVHALTKVFKDMGVKAEAVWGGMHPDDRRWALEKFAAGDIRVIVNCGVLTEGYDEPSVDCIIMARPTRSRLLYMQMLGRGTRPYPGKTDCLVIDVADNCANNDALQLPALFGYDSLDCSSLLEALRKRAEAGRVRGREKRGKEQAQPHERPPLLPPAEIQAREVEILSRSEFRWTVVGGIMRLPVGSGEYLYLERIKPDEYVVVHRAGGKARIISDPLDLGYAQGFAEDWLRKQGNKKKALASKEAAWRDKAPTDEQLRLLKQLRIYRKGMKRGDAADAIERFFASREAKRMRAKAQKKMQKRG